MNVRFRRATPADLEAVVALLADDPIGRGREEATLPLKAAYVDAFAAVDADPNQLLAVAERVDDRADRRIVGVLQLSFIPGLSRMGAWRGQIESVRIAASERGAGLGRAFFEWAIERCRERGCRLAQLTSDADRPDARRFYEGLGFVASHIGFKLAL